MPKRSLGVFTAGLALRLTAGVAGTFSSDFSDPAQPGFTLTGTAAIRNGQLVMTTQGGGGGSQNTVNLDDLDAGGAVESFTASFRLKFGPSSVPPADGLCF